MLDRNIKKKIEAEHPNKTFDVLVESKMERKGLTKEEAILDVYKTSTKTNSNVNKELGL